MMARQVSGLAAGCLHESGSRLPQSNGSISLQQEFLLIVGYHTGGSAICLFIRTETLLPCREFELSFR
jgi:hypothetical protein